MDILTDPAEFAIRLKVARIRAVLTQAEAAEVIGCSFRSFQDYERGRYFPRPAIRRRVLAFIAEHDGTGVTDRRPSLRSSPQAATEGAFFSAGAPSTPNR